MDSSESPVMGPKRESPTTALRVRMLSPGLFLLNHFGDSATVPCFARAIVHSAQAVAGGHWSQS